MMDEINVGEGMVPRNQGSIEGEAKEKVKQLEGGSCAI
jgi:hypothetical protein